MILETFLDSQMKPIDAEKASFIKVETVGDTTGEPLRSVILKIIRPLASAGSEFDESEHPRGADGKFAPKGEGAEGVKKGKEAKILAPAIIKSSGKDKSKRVYNREISNIPYDPDKRISIYKDTGTQDSLPDTLAYIKNTIQAKPEWYVGFNEKYNIGEFKINGTNVNVNQKALPTNLNAKLDRLKTAFDYSNIPENERPTIEFLGRTTTYTVIYAGADGSTYSAEAEALAVPSENILVIYDDADPDKLIDHEVGHFEYETLGKSSLELPEVAYGLNVRGRIIEVDDYNKMVEIFKVRSYNPKRIEISDLFGDDEKEKANGLTDALNAKGLTRTNAYAAYEAIRTRIQGDAPIELTPDVKTALEEYKQEKIKSTEWAQITEAEPFQNNYYGRNPHENFAQSYVEVKNALKQNALDNSHPDDSVFAKENPVKYKFMKENVFKKFIPERRA